MALPKDLKFVNEWVWLESCLL